MPAAHEWPAIVNPHDNTPAVTNLYQRSKRQSAVRRSHGRTIHGSTSLLPYRLLKSLSREDLHDHAIRYRQGGFAVGNGHTMGPRAFGAGSCCRSVGAFI